MEEILIVLMMRDVSNHKKKYAQYSWIIRQFTNTNGGKYLLKLRRTRIHTQIWQ